MTRSSQQVMSLSPGTRLGHDDVITLIGEGGMGEVYIGWRSCRDAVYRHC